jgi:hypothetical protein
VISRTPILAATLSPASATGNEYRLADRRQQFGVHLRTRVRASARGCFVAHAATRAADYRFASSPAASSSMMASESSVGRNVRDRTRV